MPPDGCVALPHGATGLCSFVIVVFMITLIYFFSQRKKQQQSIVEYDIIKEDSLVPGHMAFKLAFKRLILNLNLKSLNMFEGGSYQ